jgi:D-inositol-3-phosphate glycosyltransferase
MKIALVARHITAASQPDAATGDHYSADQASHAEGLGRALAADGHRVVIYARKDSPGLPDTEMLSARLKVEYVTAGPPAPVPAQELPSHLGAFGSQLAARWSKSAPEVVHAHHWTSGLAAMIATRDRAVPVVQTFGSLCSAERRSGLSGTTDAARERMETCLARSAAGVIAMTSDEVAELSRMGVGGPRVAAVPTGVDMRKFDPEGPSAKRGEPQRLVHVGSLAEHERLELLIRAMPDLRGTELVIVGGPDPADLDSDRAYKRLGKLAAGLGVADRVIFTGRLADRELAAMLRSATALVSLTRHAPIGQAAISAMACGIPVIATDVGAHSDAVIDGTTGTLVPADRPALAARRLKDLLATPMKLTAFGIASSDRARSRFPWDRIAAETVKSYERWLTAPAAQPSRAVRVPAQRPNAAAARRTAAA